LNQLEFYDTLNIPSLPLPSNVLPANIVGHISREDLQKRLSLSEVSVKNLVQYYLNENQHYLFRNENTSTILLSFISQHWNKLNDTDWTLIKMVLSNINCIPTSQGMQLPNESYIHSSNLSADLPIITLYLAQIMISSNEKEKQKSTEYPVSIEFLKIIGCRTIRVPTVATESDTSPTANSQTIQTFIQDMLEQRKNMSESDLNALKQSACLRGTTLTSSKETTRQYVPCDLHFPSVASRLCWLTLPIIDWQDIDSCSREYAFLKEIGVREVPILQKLIDRIVEEHNNGPTTKTEYKLPLALGFFADHFQQHYSKLWKTANIQHAFLPSSSPNVNRDTLVVLAMPDSVFKGLFVSLKEILLMPVSFYDIRAKSIVFLSST
jgi:hypothetical protein